jgi:hypothetical protein
MIVATPTDHDGTVASRVRWLIIIEAPQQSIVLQKPRLPPAGVFL